MKNTTNRRQFVNDKCDENLENCVMELEEKIEEAADNCKALIKKQITIKVTTGVVDVELQTKLDAQRLNLAGCLWRKEFIKTNPLVVLYQAFEESINRWADTELGKVLVAKIDEKATMDELISHIANEAKEMNSKNSLHEYLDTIIEEAIWEREDDGC